MSGAVVFNKMVRDSIEDQHINCIEINLICNTKLVNRERNGHVDCSVNEIGNAAQDCFCDTMRASHRISDPFHGRV